MGTTFAIWRREFKSYFNSPIAYFVITIFLVLVGSLFFISFFTQDRVSMRGFFSIVPLMFVFFCPAITMRLISEERRTGTFEMLITMPVRDAEIIMGKFLAAFSLLIIALVLTLPYALTVSSFGLLDWGPVWGGYLGLVLLGGVFLTIGLMASSFSENQIVAFVVALFLSMILLMFDKFLMYLPAYVAPWFEYVSFNYHFRNASRGIIDSRDIIYYLSFGTLFLFIAFRQLESRRWR